MASAAAAPPPVQVPAHIADSAICTDYRRLREDEVESLRQELKRFDGDNTKISVEELKKKKDLVDWLLNLLTKEVKLKNLTWKKPFKAGSAYEKVQAGEAQDFDVMMFLDISKGVWKVEKDVSRPGFCTIELMALRAKTKKAAGAQKTAKSTNNKRKDLILQLLDKDRRLSALKVRKLFTSRIDKALKKKSPLIYKTKADGSSIEKEVAVTVHRRQRGPATTLAIACPSLDISMFTLDIVNCLHASQLSSKQQKQTCDFVAKPIDKQQAFEEENAPLWRMSYSRQESRKFKAIDAENKIHRRVLRVFKILRSNQSQLKHLKSYIYKNVLLFLSEMADKSWNENDIPNRFVDMIISLRNYLAVKNLPVYFNPEINLLADYEDKQIEKVKGFLKRIANKGIEGYKELLALKEKQEMDKIATAQGGRKKRRRKSKPKTKKKVAKVTYKDVFGESKKRKPQQKKTTAARMKLQDINPRTAAAITPDDLSCFLDSSGPSDDEFERSEHGFEVNSFDVDMVEDDDFGCSFEENHSVEYEDDLNFDPVDDFVDTNFGDTAFDY